jgi:hypothetical protein
MYTVYFPWTASFFTQIYFSYSYYIFIFTLRSNFARKSHYITANSKYEYSPNEIKGSAYVFFKVCVHCLQWPSSPLRSEVFCRIFSEHFCQVFQILPVAPVITVTIFTLTFHMCYISASQSSFFCIFMLLSYYIFTELHR